MTNDALERGKERYASEPELAINDFTEAIHAKPNDSEAFRWRAITYMQLEKYSNAVQDYTNGIEYNPKDTNLLIGRAKAYRELREYQKAVEDIEQAIKVEQEQPSEDGFKDFALANLHIECAKVYVQLRNYTTAERHLNEAVQLEAKHNQTSALEARIEFYRNTVKNFTKAELDFNELIHLTDTKDNRFGRGEFLREDKQDYHRAIDDYTKAVKMAQADGDSVSDIWSPLKRSLDGRATCYMNTGQHALALADFTLVIEASQEDTWGDNKNLSYSYANRALCYAILGDAEKAIYDFERALELGNDRVSEIQANIQQLKKSLKPKWKFW
ncbi:MAG: tetratricopeptide repeat protein [Chloroflexi bacterium]|nr:tetratricopeptide repeat protein [Chloroflexota bacterium]